MKKKALIFLVSLLLLSTGISLAQVSNNSELTEAIKTYKSGNYSECYVMLENIIKNDSANPLAYYYMAMTSAQIGRKEEAISNYDKAIVLLSTDNNLRRYALKGKRCLESPDKCDNKLLDSIDDNFILNKNGTKFSEEVQGELELLKIKNLMRDINKDNIIDPSRFEKFKDFSSMPTDEEIVVALKTLEKAGFHNLLNSNNSLSVSTFMNNNQDNSILNLMGNSSLNPMLIQSLITNGINQGF